MTNIEKALLLDTLGAYKNPPSPQFLYWIADRLVHRYNESELTDFVHATRELASNLDKLIRLVNLKQ